MIGRVLYAASSQPFCEITSPHRSTSPVLQITWYSFAPAGGVKRRATIAGNDRRPAVSRTKSSTALARIETPKRRITRSMSFALQTMRLAELVRRARKADERSTAEIGRAHV